MSRLYNFEKVSDLLSCAGQPTEDQLKQLADEKYDTVVNLGMTDMRYALPNEEALVKALGMDYFHIPVVFENPQINELTDFIVYMNGNAGKKIIVHCAANYRASVFTGLYLFSKAEVTEEEMQHFIEDVWQPNTVWQSFIEESVEYIKASPMFSPI